VEEQASPCRIPVVDDHAFIREGTRTALAAVDGLGVVVVGPKTAPRRSEPSCAKGLCGTYRTIRLGCTLASLVSIFVGQGSRQGSLAFFQRSAGGGIGACAVKTSA